MLTVKIINYNNINECINILKRNNDDFNFFKNIGWSDRQFKYQLNGQHNHSLGLWYNDTLIAFIVGNIMSVKKKLEYEIFIIYVDNKYRNNRYATLLIKAIANYPYSLKLNRIALEVSESNIAAINLYKKCNFDLIGKRNNYYSFNNVKENALIFEKKINK